jgi:hypothetical protein
MMTKDHDVISASQEMLFRNVQDGGVRRRSKMGSKIGSDLCAKEYITRRTENLTRCPLDHKKALFLP